MTFSQIYREIDNKGVLYAWFPAMHTRVDLMICGKSREKLVEVAEEIKSELSCLEAIGNYYDVQSELFNVNREASRNPVAISRDLYIMVETCLEYHARTSGYFDISIHSDGYDGTSLQGIRLIPETMSIFFSTPGIKINLSGFLKGYALDEIKKIITRRGIQDALINLGNSSVMAMGNHPAGEGWKVAPGVQPALPENEVHLFNQFLTVSGNETETRKHIVSPRTGRQIEGKMQIGVVTDSGTLGEILSTGLFAAYPADREQLIHDFNVKTYLF